MKGTHLYSVVRDCCRIGAAPRLREVLNDDAEEIVDIFYDDNILLQFALGENDPDLLNVLIDYYINKVIPALIKEDIDYYIDKVIPALIEGDIAYYDKHMVPTLTQDDIAVGYNKPTQQQNKWLATQLELRAQQIKLRPKQLELLAKQNLAEELDVAIACTSSITPAVWKVVEKHLLSGDEDYFGDFADLESIKQEYEQAQTTTDSGNNNCFLPTKENLELLSEDFQQHPMHWAISNNNLKLVQILLKHTAIEEKKKSAKQEKDEKPNDSLSIYDLIKPSTEYYGYTPLRLAIHKDQHEIFQELVKKIEEKGQDFLSQSIVEVDEAGETLLHQAVRLGRMQVMKLLLEKVPELARVSNKDGQLPLHIAVSKDYSKVVQELLPYTKPEDITNPVTILKIAVKHDEIIFTELANKLSKKGENFIKKAISSVKEVDENLLQVAVRLGDVQIVQLLLQNMKIEDVTRPLTILRMAAKQKEEKIFLELFNKLREKGSDFIKEAASSVDEFDQTLLHLASWSGHVKVASMLLENMTPKDILKQNKNNKYTALHFAVQAGRQEVIKLLLEKAPKLAAIADQNNQLPLYWAVSKNNNEIAKVLIDAMDTVTVDIASTHQSQTPLILAASNGNIVILQTLLNKLTGDNLKSAITKKALGWNALHWAIKNGKYEAVELLSESKYMSAEEIAAASEHNDETALHLASGQPAIMKLLSQRLGAKYKDALSKVDNLGRTPLSWAVIKESPEVVEMLFKSMHDNAILQGAKSNNNFTALHYAINTGNKKIVDLLLGRMPILVQKSDIFGQLPLHWAVSKGDLEAVKLLLKNMEPEDVAKPSKHQEQTVVRLAAVQNDENILKEIIKKLKEKSEDFAKKAIALEDEFGQAPLHLAAFVGNTKTVELLLNEMNKEAIAKKKATDGYTALHFAVQANHPKVVELLIQKAPELIIIPDAYGQLPLHWAAHKGNVEIVKLLLNNMLAKDVDVATADGTTALKFASDKNHQGIIELLKEKLNVPKLSKAKIEQDCPDNDDAKKIINLSAESMPEETDVINIALVQSAAIDENTVVTAGNDSSGNAYSDLTAYYNGGPVFAC